MDVPLGETIRQRRAEKRLTLRAAAAAANISPAMLSMIESGSTAPSTDTVAALATVLKADVDQWCALIGRVSPSAERDLSRLARDHPEIFRNMLSTARRRR